MTQVSIDAFWEKQKEHVASKASLRQRKGFVSDLYRRLSDDKLLTKERLSAWREDLQREVIAQVDIPV